jgi:hypothetical protein
MSKDWHLHKTVYFIPDILFLYPCTSTSTIMIPQQSTWLHPQDSRADNATLFALTDRDIPSPSTTATPPTHSRRSTLVIFTKCRKNIPWSGISRNWVGKSPILFETVSSSASYSRRRWWSTSSGFVACMVWSVGRKWVQIARMLWRSDPAVRGSSRTL